MKKIFAFLTTSAICFGSIHFTQPASSHPHVFAEASLELATNEAGELVELRHVWRFDEFFSSSVLIDFDENKNLKLDEDELTKIGTVVHGSLAEFNYYTDVTVDGYNLNMAPPDVIIADFVDNQLLFVFAMRPVHPLILEGKVTAGVYDPTFYASIDFINDSDLSITGPHADKCEKKVVRPNSDEVLAQNQGSLTDAFYEDEENNDISKLFATRIEVTC